MKVRFLVFNGLHLNATNNAFAHSDASGNCRKKEILEVSEIAKSSACKPRPRVIKLDAIDSLHAVSLSCTPSSVQNAKRLWISCSACFKISSLNRRTWKYFSAKAIARHRAIYASPIKRKKSKSLCVFYLVHCQFTK